MPRATLLHTVRNLFARNKLLSLKVQTQTYWTSASLQQCKTQMLCCKLQETFLPFSGNLLMEPFFLALVVVTPPISDKEFVSPNLMF